ncbi:hypothetical protein RRG08_033231 [Elysia crispata]|uniref:Uncharacterized protein n=1 Tax=Elysia crispata TaxID=231223 RepID=A0AAE1CTP9_9GAST|nr:hypothetical protein RRG08_033231 [Elysia crispata]
MIIHHKHHLMIGSCFTKCFKTSRNNSVFIQPDGLTNPSEPCGAPRIKVSLKFFRGNTRTGGTEVPAAETMAQTVPALLFLVKQLSQLACCLSLPKSLGLVRQVEDSTCCSLCL